MRSDYSGRIGERFGKLTFLSVREGRHGSGHVIGVFQCECGAVIDRLVSRVVLRRKTTHCGCVPKVGRTPVHGMKHTREYVTWTQMRARCRDKNHKDYPRYGARGITVCPQWESFETFLADVGPRPEGMTLDRRDNNKGYEPGNVRWATAKEQARNTRNSVRWHVKGADFETAADAARHYGVGINVIKRWVQQEEASYAVKLYQ